MSHLHLQKHRRFVRWHPEVSWDRKLQSLVTLEPIWSVYVESSPAYWRSLSGPDSCWFNLSFANPIYFCLAAGLVAWGAFKSWLTRYEVVVSIALLAIPYVTRAQETCMTSHGRFASVVFPAYIVAGHVCERLPLIVIGSALLAGGALMGVYLGLFAMGFALL